MHCYVVNRSIAGEDSAQTIEQIFKWLTSAGIDGQHIEINSNTHLDKKYHKAFADSLPPDCNTLVAIGDDETFDSLLAMSASLPDKMVYGYIPTVPGSNTTKSLGLKDWREAATAVRNRRLEQTAVLEYTGGVILFEQTFSCRPKQAGSIENLMLKVDSQLDLKISAQTIKINNLSRDNFVREHCLHIAAWTKPDLPTGKFDEKFIKLKQLKQPTSTPSELVLRLTASELKLSSAETVLTNNHGRKVDLPLSIRASKHKLRLIIKKANPQNLRSI